MVWFSHSSWVWCCVYFLMVLSYPSSFWVVLPSPPHPFGWRVPSSKRSCMIYFNYITKSNQAPRAAPRQRSRKGSSTTQRREGKSTTALLEGVVAVSSWVVLHSAHSFCVVLIFPSFLWVGGAFLLFPFGWWFFAAAFTCVLLLAILLGVWRKMCSSTGLRH